jgi:hypothetical protein
VVMHSRSAIARVAIVFGWWCCAFGVVASVAFYRSIPFYRSLLGGGVWCAFIQRPRRYFPSRPASVHS